ncbi:MAG: carbon starvation protein A [Verrucomicrobia bacterium]|mgnify:FL=1|jgi:carbon starvation protein|nr:carbon starvation protein A [Verrucomicrobiota bacterium]MBT7066476.1 carbon starvation protein A [Verrucomicrobiota bacterium]MBT7702199.1 carbon starvation protein A [Verrucomicrobiota bacterium]
MNGAVLVLGGSVIFLVAYFVYGHYLEKLFGTDDTRLTPAHTRKDGVDFVPTSPAVLFGHHFASIAGAGPIVGPILAAYFGWGAVALWVLVGCIFLGAMHDFAALFLSVRDEGRSIGHVIERELGYTGRQIFLLFAWAALVLVDAIFALLVAKTFVATPSVATASLLFIGMAPLFGWLVYKKGLSIRMGSLIFVPLLFFFVWLGSVMPLDLTAHLGWSVETARRFWLIILFAYVFVASTIPVWLLLQPRDYLNSYLLYAMMLIGFVGILFARPVLSMPAFEGWVVERPAGGMGSIFPLLFVTVACGAISGFHSLVASGTTSKQLSREKHIRVVGYGSMLVEGVLALMALTAVAVLSRGDYVAALQTQGPVATFANGLAGFAAQVGLPVSVGKTFIALAISAFMLTTLDTATRLTRFTWQELFLPDAKHGGREADQKPWARLCSNRYVATGVAIGCAGYMAMSGNAMQIWPVFGASNQLLAALTLLVVTLVLVRQHANFWVSLLPMLFMMLVCVWALVSLVISNLKAEEINWTLVVTSAFLLVMAFVLLVRAAVAALGSAKPSHQAG